MKYTITLILLFISFICAGQSFTNDRSSSSITVQDARWRGRLNMYLPHTHGLTLNGGLDTLGAMIYEDSSRHIWVRDSVLSGGHTWAKIVFGSDPVVVNANNGIFYNSNILQFGEPDGQSGSPSRFLVNRTVPFGGNRLVFLDSLESSTTQSSVRFFDTTLSGPANIKMIQNGVTDFAGGGVFQIWQPTNYGRTYNNPFIPGGTQTAGRVLMGYRSETSIDTMPDNVYHTFCYNCNNNGSREFANEAQFSTRVETNYKGTVGGFGDDFEFHDPEVTLFDGTIWRTDSKYINKSNGFCLEQSYIDDHEYYTVKSGVSTRFAEISATGSPGSIAGRLILQGQSGTSTPGIIQFLDGSLRSSFIGGTNGGNLFFSSNQTFGFNELKIEGILQNNYLNECVDLDPTHVGSTLIGQDSLELAPDPSSQLDIVSKHRGLLIPRMTSLQQNAISAPALGLHVSNSDSAYGMTYYDGTAWNAYATRNYIKGLGYLTTIAGIAAGGDLTGTYPNPTVGANKVTNTQLAQMAAHTYKGNNTGSTANAADITATQLRADIGIIANSFSGVGTATTVFTVTIGTTQANTTYKVNVTPTNILSAALFYVTNKTATTFDVTYLAGLTGAVTFDWSLFP